MSKQKKITNKMPDLKLQVKMAKIVADAIEEDYVANYEGEDNVTALDFLDMFGLLGFGFVVEHPIKNQRIIITREAVSTAYRETVIKNYLTSKKMSKGKSIKPKKVKQ